MDSAVYKWLIDLSPVIVAAVIGVFTIDYTRRQHERSAMSDVFKMLSDEEHKKAEHIIYKNYKGEDITKDLRDGKSLDDYRDLVSKNYALAGSMLSSRVIPKRQYYEKFGIMTVVSYYALKDYIKTRRDNGEKYHRAHFTNLAIDCFEYWDGMNKKVKPLIRKPYSEDEIYRPMLGNKLKVPKRWFFGLSQFWRGRRKYDD